MLEFDLMLSQCSEGKGQPTRVTTLSYCMVAIVITVVCRARVVHRGSTLLALVGAMAKPSSSGCALYISHYAQVEPTIMLTKTDNMRLQENRDQLHYHRV